MIFARLHNDRCQDVETLFTQALNDPTPDNIHDFRVSIRRWKMSSDLAVSCRLLKKNGKVQNQVDVLFKAASPLRDFHVGINLLKKTIQGQFAEGFVENWGTLARPLLENFLNVCVGHLPMLQRISKRVPPAVIRKELRFKIQTRLKDLEKGFESPHEARVCIKNTKYLVEIWENCINAGIAIRKVRKSLANAQDILGDWHDHVVLRERIRITYKDRIKPAGVARLLESLDELIKVKRMLIAPSIDECLKSSLNFRTE